MAATKKAEGHEPLFHIVKRPAIAWWHAWLIRIGAVIAAGAYGSYCRISQCCSALRLP